MTIRPDPELQLSVVVPLFDEEPNVRALVQEVRQALADFEAWELVLVDDGSTDGTVRIVEEIAGELENVRGVFLARNYGQTRAMQAGFDHARGRIVVSMDGDLQNDPRDIPELLRVLASGFDLVAGYRIQRQDHFLTRRLPSKIANGIIARVTGVRIRDNGCTLKAFRRELLDRLNLYGDQHRFIPSLAASHGARITEVPVRHHPRRFGKSKYGLSRTLRVVLDLAAVKTLSNVRRRPHLLFAAAVPGLLCATLFLAAWGVAVVAFRPIKAEAVVFPGAALLFTVSAFYFLLLGLLAEVALAQHGRRSRSQVIATEIA